MPASICLSEPVSPPWGGAVPRLLWVEACEDDTGSFRVAGYSHSVLEYKYLFLEYSGKITTSDLKVQIHPSKSNFDYFFATWKQ